jgi:hypothetical protein
MNRFKKLSLASLFTLLAIAVLANLAGSATAASMTSNSGNQEKMVIPNVQFIAGTKDVNDNINLTIANIGYYNTTITACILKDETGSIVTFIEMGSSQPVIDKGSFKVITLTLRPDTLVDGYQYALTVVTSGGGSFVSPAFDTSSSTEYDPLKDADLQSRLQASVRATPPPPAPQATTTPWSSFINPVVIGSLIAAVISVGGAYKLSNYIIGSKNKKDRYVLFFFISVILISIIVWVVTAYFFTSGYLSTM